MNAFGLNSRIPAMAAPPILPPAVAGMPLVGSLPEFIRDPRFFDEPPQFNPGRWTEEFQKRLPKCAYFPFGGGPRVCIGAGFAMMEAVLLLATIARRFHLALVPGQKVTPWPSIALRPREGVLALPARR